MKLRLIRGGRSSPLAPCSTRRWRDGLAYTHRARRWTQSFAKAAAARIVDDALYYHSERLSSLGWKLERYTEVQTHHRAITSRHIVDLSLRTRCLGNGQASTTLDVDLDLGDI